MRWFIIVALIAALVGCSRKQDDASCGAVATRLFSLAREQLAAAQVEPAIRRAVADQLPAMRDSLAQACSAGKWSTQVRNCMVTAGDHVALQACQQQLTDEQRRGLDRARAGATTSH